MKKIILPLVISIIILISNFSYADIATKAKVNVTAVRIRESASTDSGIVTNIYEDDEVEVLETSGEWYKVKYGDSVGYAKSEFFTITQEGDNSSKTASDNSTEAIANEVNTPVENTTNSSVADNSSVTENTVNNEISTNSAEVTNNANNTSSFSATEISIGNNITLSNAIKVRNIPSVSASERYEIKQGETVIIETSMGNWYKLTSQDITGWIAKNKLVAEQSKIVEQPKEPEVTEPVPQQTPEVTTPEQQAENVEPEKPTTEPDTTKEPESTTSTNRTGIVTVETARVREKASTSAEVIDTVDEDDIVNIIGEEGNFYKITKGDLTGYISKDLVKEKEISSRGITGDRVSTINQDENNKVSEMLSVGTSNSVTGTAVVEFAKQYLGYKYVSGGSTPESGFDCSGFTRYVFSHFGYNIGRVAADQASAGNAVERANMQPGDLILFYDDAKTKIGHCAIYMGDGNFIHSANPQRGVVIDNINTNSYYNTRFVTARRIV